MIPAQSYEQLLRISFGFVAMRRGGHWNLVKAEVPGFGTVDEAALLAEAIAGVMKHVPLPTRQLGIGADLLTLATALYSTIGPRLQLDGEIERHKLEQAVAGVPTGSQPTYPPPPASEPAPAARRAPTAADVLAGMPIDPLAAVTHDVAGPTVAESDPELIERIAENGATPAAVVRETGAGEDRPLLDLLAPPIEFDLHPTEE